MSTTTSSSRRFSRGGIIAGIVLIFILAFGWTIIEWTYNRVYVPEGYSMRLRFKGPPLPFLPYHNLPDSKTGFATLDENGNIIEKGVLVEMLGPGRHFLSPLRSYWDFELVPDVVIKPGEIGIATSKTGKALSGGKYLVDGDLGETEYKGDLRKVFGPGRYRVNDYAYEFKKVTLVKTTDGNQTKYAGWVQIPTGHVGVVTNLTDNPETGAVKGIQDDVLPPGIYPVNAREQQVDIVEIGYREKTIEAELNKNADGSLKYDEAGEPTVVPTQKGISFPSNDAFDITMDFTAIWGINPDQAPEVIRKFGNVEAIETKVVLPQIESICRTIGSKYDAVDLLVGESRQEFQKAATDEFKVALEEKDITLLYGLVRHIYIPQNIRLFKQKAFISEELKLTRIEQQITAETQGDLKEAEQKVELETEKIRAETEKLVANAMAEGRKTAQETEAETQRLVAEIDREIALLEAQATVLLGQATAEAKKVKAEAEAEKFKLAVDAFGTGDAYNMWVFANGLPEDIELNLIFAGDGTFWTDLRGFSETMLGRQTQMQQNSSKPQAKP